MKLSKYENGYVLKNKVIELWMNQQGYADKLLYKNKNLINKLDGNIIDPDRHHSFYLDYHQDLQSKHPNYSQLEVVEDTDVTKHLVWKDINSDLALEYHLIMNSEESKLYSYVVAKNNTNKTYKINELRTVYRLDSSIFPYSKTAARIGLQPSSNYTNQFIKLQDETYKMPDGERFSNSKIYSKYDYADYFKDNEYWGFFGNKVGFWFIPVFKDYYPSGPLKQELMVHYDGILLNYLDGAHFGTGDFTIKPGWEKCYGPWCLYINTGDNPNEMFKDAKETAYSEKTKWPYEWMKEKDYPISRPTVVGQIDKKNKSKMTVILSKGQNNFAKSSADYIYYAKSDENGLFKIDNVRPGKYKMTVYYDSGEILGEFVKENIVVSATEKIINIGKIKFEDMQTPDVVWQIGSASHTSEPFNFSYELRNTIWRSLVPNNLDYYIGTSTPQNDWFAIQSYKGRWNIHFDSLEPEKEYELKIALAGASKTKADHENDRGHRDPTIDIYINGAAVKHEVLLDDNAVYRNALKNGSYHLIKVSVPKKILIKTNNIITLKTSGYLIYDTVELVRK